MVDAVPLPSHTAAGSGRPVASLKSQPRGGRAFERHTRPDPRRYKNPQRLASDSQSGQSARVPGTPQEANGDDLTDARSTDQVTQTPVAAQPVGLVAAVVAALLGQFFAAVSGLGTFGIAQPGHHHSETPGRDIVGGFVWIVIPGLGVLAGAEALYRLRHNLAATIVLSATWLASPSSVVSCDGLIGYDVRRTSRERWDERSAYLLISRTLFCVSPRACAGSEDRAFGALATASTSGRCWQRAGRRSKRRSDRTPLVWAGAGATDRRRLQRYRACMTEGACSCRVGGHVGWPREGSRR